jgi:hypothetical protein
MLGDLVNIGRRGRADDGVGALEGQIGQREPDGQNDRHEQRGDRGAKADPHALKQPQQFAAGRAIAFLPDLDPEPSSPIVLPIPRCLP